MPRRGTLSCVPANERMPGEKPERAESPRDGAGRRGGLKQDVADLCQSALLVDDDHEIVLVERADLVQAVEEQRAAAGLTGDRAKAVGADAEPDVRVLGLDLAEVDALLDRRADPAVAEHARLQVV